MPSRPRASRLARSSRIGRRSLLAILLLCLAAFTLAPIHARQDPRVVAIGDIHGAFDAFTAILRHTGLIDAGARWSGGKSVLVQTGDYTDRGAGVRAVLDLLMALERQAKAAGGRAEIVLGNHEVMNIMGDLRDVSPPIFASFATADSERRRAEAFDQYARLAERRRQSGRDVDPVYLQTRDDWMAAHPPGWLEYWDAMAPRGKYGAWLRGKDIFAVVSRTLFMHAGLDPTAEPVPRARDANEQVRAELRRLDRFRERLADTGLGLPFFTFDEVMRVALAEVRAASTILAAAQEKGRRPDLRGFDLGVLREADELMRISDWAILAQHGPLWYRGYALEPDDTLAAPLAALLQGNGVARVVTGHTPQINGIATRLDGRLVLIDTGMLAEVYAGRPAALEIAGGRMTAVYLDARQVLTAKPGQ